MISNLATYTRLTNACTKGRNGKSVDTITIHCTASSTENVSAKAVCDYFNSGVQASSQYTVGGAGDIACCVDEDDRAWTSGGTKTVAGETGSQNDYHAITLEVASNSSGTVVTDKAIEATIALCVDICKRYGKTKAVWFGDNAEKMVSYKPAANEMKFTWHRWFANKACPGQAIMDKFQYIIDSINAQLEKKVETGTTQATIFANMSEKDAVEAIGKICQKDMEVSGILASLSAAQFILESGYGKSELAQNANNMFGMKKSLSGNTWSGTSWDGVSVYTKNTAEQNADGTYVTITADFRKYSCIEDSVADHSAYLLGAKKGSELRYPGLKGCTDYREAAKIVKAGGYATSLTYVDHVCKLIEQYDLTRFDVKSDEQPVSNVLYRVQIGAFTIEENAARCLQEARKKIAGDAFITKVDKYFKVQVGAYRVFENAVAMQDKCKMLGYNDAWITTNEVNIKPARKTVEELAAEVINGDWGNGQERKDRLTEAGYDYSEVQSLVNKIMEG